MPRTWTKEDYLEIVRLRNDGMEYKEIAEIFGVSTENANAAYRRAVPAKCGSIKGKTEYIPKKETESTVEEDEVYEEGDDFINVVCASKRVLTKDDIIEKFNIDLNVWEIERFKVKTSEGYRKDRSVDWHVKDGQVTSGDVSDSGKMLVVPLYHVEVRLRRKTQEVRIRSVVKDLLEDLKRFSPIYPKIEYPKVEGGYLFEPALFDIHFGRLTWDEETGESYDIKIAETMIKSSILKHLSMVKNLPISKILLPLGNDFFNVDNKFNTTTRGTPQQEDTRWQKTFVKGCEICAWMIDTCSQIATVDVLIIPGNHDVERSFYMGEVLKARYTNSQNITIDNSAASNKYYLFGKTLLGFTHGGDTKLERLPFIMANDKPDLWAKSTYREWHTGDKHHKKELAPIADESSGMVIRIIRSIVPYDSWTYNSGYRSLRASESFLWHPENGLTAQYTVLPDVIQ